MDACDSTSLGDDVLEGDAPELGGPPSLASRFARICATCSSAGLLGGRGELTLSASEVTSGMAASWGSDGGSEAGGAGCGCGCSSVGPFMAGYSK